MLMLPWSEKEKSSKELLEEEVNRQLRIMALNDPDSEEYKKSLVYYERLHENLLKEENLKESKSSRWFNALATIVLAGVTLTAESWTPLTSKWYNSLMRPIKGDRDVF